ncbi:MAG TPA: Wzz/FepE/Etk N-terminal domain-containing protein [Bryobacteraceae bacterium]|nr:Wzz/FepE/Etk N-terminal domain-containing protein [Bryobacteraceae bacterium]
MPNEATTDTQDPRRVADSDSSFDFIPDEPVMSLREVLAIFLKRKWLILGVAATGAIAAAVGAIRIPDSFTATAVIMPPQQAQSSASALLGQLGPIAAMAGRDMGLRSPADLYVGLLGSRTIADHLIEQFALKAVYRTRTATDTRARLRSRVRVSSGRDTLIRIEVEDTDANRAATMANGFVSELNEQNRKFAITEASQRRQFLEQRLIEAKDGLAAAEAAMKQLQSQTGLVQLDAQTSIAIGTAAQLKAQLTAGEVALQRLKMGATDQNPEVLNVEAELDALRAELRKARSSAQPGDDGPLIASSKLPQAGLDYIRRLRDLKYNEFLYELLSKQYEAARIDESKAAPALQIVDAAVPPDTKSGPHRTLITGFGGLGAALLGCIIAYTRHVQTGSAG